VTAKTERRQWQRQREELMAKTEKGGNSTAERGGDSKDREMR